MIKIPDNVDDCTIGTITDLLHEGYDENHILEFKREVNPDGDRIGRTACAFANTMGGYIILGIDPAKEKEIHERIIGLDNSDQLKSSILNQINNIKPNIPTQNLIFKKNNINLKNGKIIIILTIEPSVSLIHQFNDIFYKRLPDGNKPMEVDEIVNKIISTRQHQLLFNLLLVEGGLIRDNLNFAKAELGKNNIDEALIQFEFLKNDSFHHFLYNQAYLSAPEVQQCIYTIVDTTEKLTLGIARIFKQMEEKKIFTKEYLAEKNVDTEEEYMKKIALHQIDAVLSNLELFERLTNSKFHTPDLDPLF